MSDVFSLKKQLIVYGSHHNNKINVAIHMVFVPTIFWSALVMSAKSGPLLSSKSILSLFETNIPFFVVLGYLGYYALLDPVAAALISPILATMQYTATDFYKSNANANKIALSIHVVSWIFQFLGHGLAEKRSPKLLDNIVQALVSAPYFVFFEILFKLGYRPELHREVMNEIKKDVAAFRMRKSKRI